MRVLLDECIDRKFKSYLQGHIVTTVQERGWAGKKNGELLTLAHHEFEVFVTVDQNLRFQQNLLESTLALVVLQPRSNRLDALKLLVPKLVRTLETIHEGELIVIE